ncbi:hypothetical protein Esti_004877 [Eimeria stiedai]
MAAEAAASTACGRSSISQRPLSRVSGKPQGPGSRCSGSRFFMGATWATLVLLLLLQQQQCATAIVCEIDAREGLEAATASVAAAASDRQQLLHMLPLCRVPYLVNSQLPPKDVPHVGMEKGGTVTIDLQLLPSDYKNNMPARGPRFPRVSRGLPVAEESASASEYAKYKRQQQRQQQPHFRQVEERHDTSSRSSGGAAGTPPTGMLLHTDVTEGPLAALSATFPLLVHAGRRLSELFTHAQEQQQQPQQQHHRQQQQEQQPWLPRTLATALRVAGDGFELVLSNLVGVNHRSPRLLLSSLYPSSPSSPAAAAVSAPASSTVHPARSLHQTDAAPAAAAAEVAEEAAVPPLARIARRRDCGRQVHRRTVGCPEWEAPPAHPVRQLSKSDEDELLRDGLVHSVNNTSLLLLDHGQLYFLETHESWLPSFTAEAGLVLNSYMPSMLRLPFTGPRLQTTISLPYRDRYALVLLNADGLNLKLQGSVSFWGPTQQHLSLEQKHLPEAVAFLMLLNLLAACILGVLQLTRWKGHNLFLSVLFMINFSLAGLAFGLDWRQAKIVEATGRRPAALWQGSRYTRWSWCRVASRLMRKLQDVSQLLVFIFVSLGFDVIRSRLSRLEMQFIAGLAVISLYLGVFEETRYIFHAAGYVRVLIAIHSNIVLLHNQIADSSLTSAVGELYSKLAAYQRFRWIFFAFLLKPVFSVFFKVTFLGPIYEQLLSWDEWIYVIFENGTDFVVVAALCWDFCPPRSFKVLQLVATESTDAPAEQQQRDLVRDD